MKKTKGFLIILLFWIGILISIQFLAFLIGYHFESKEFPMLSIMIGALLSFFVFIPGLMISLVYFLSGNKNQARSIGVHKPND